MRSTTSRLTPAIIVLTIWMALSVYLGARDVFVTDPASPPSALLLSVVIPPFLFALSYKLSAGFRDYVLRLDLRLLTAVQGWRIIGVMFLVLMVFGLLPGIFAWPAGIGDIIVGAYAPFVVYVLARRSAHWRNHVILLSALGLIDFVGAIGGGVLGGDGPLGLMHGGVTTEIMQVLPLSIIPTFAVPAWILVHIISLIKVAKDEVPELGSEG